MIALLLVAGSLGVDNFAACTAIGLAGVDRALRVRIALVFGFFEAGMPVIGLLLGRGLSHTLGAQAHLAGGGLLAAAGVYTVLEGVRSDAAPAADLGRAGMTRLLLLAAGLSVDNLIVGFALGTHRAPLVLAIALIAVVSVGLSLVGLDLGSRIGTGVQRRSELLGGVVLIGVGAAIAGQLI